MKYIRKNLSKFVNLDLQEKLTVLFIYAIELELSFKPRALFDVTYYNYVFILIFILDVRYFIQCSLMKWFVYYTVLKTNI